MEEPAAGGGAGGGGGGGGGGGTGGGGGFVDIEVGLPGCERPVVVRRRDLEWGEDFVDPSFFDPGYSVAASTGHVMWEGSWALIRLLQSLPDAPQRAGGGRLSRLVRGRRVVELGAGTGLLGLCMAARGAHVLLTDVRPVVEDTLRGNVARNAGGADGGGGATPGGRGWAGAVRVGEGSARAATLDWTDPVQAQCEGGNDPREAQVVVAAECIWLRDLLEPFLATALALMRGPARPPCLLCFRERAKEGSSVFQNLEQVLGAFRARGCLVAEFHREASREDAAREVLVFRITLPDSDPAAAAGSPA